MSLEVSSSPPQYSQQSSLSRETDPQKLKSLLTREKQNLQQAGDAQEKQKIQSRISKIEAQISKVEKSEQPAETDTANTAAARKTGTATTDQLTASSRTEQDPLKPGYRLDVTV